MSTASPDNYVARVFSLLNSNPTAQNLDELVEAHVRIGYIAAQAENEYERAVDLRRYAEAEAYIRSKKSGDKVTDKMADTMALVECREQRDAEAEAKVRFRKISNLLESIEQAIMAIKFLGRYDGAGTLNTPR
jgi:hypothetical protein